MSKTYAIYISYDSELNFKSNSVNRIFTDGTRNYGLRLVLVAMDITLGIVDPIRPVNESGWS